MELQAQIDELKEEVAQLKALLHGGDAKFGIITCKGWRVVDKDGKTRINATTFADGTAGVSWIDKDGKMRIIAATSADGRAGMQWDDKDGKMRIGAATLADGSVVLPTEDLKK